MKVGALVKYTYWFGNNLTQRHEDVGIVLELLDDSEQPAKCWYSKIRVLFNRSGTVKIVWANETEPLNV